MKKIFFALALVASLQAFDAQAQSKSPAAAKAAVDKAAAAVANPKANTKTATWLKYGQTLMDAYNAPTANYWAGMSRQELQVLSGSDKPQSESQVTVGGRQFTKAAYANKNLYFNEQGVLELMEVTTPIVENALEKAVDAYTNAAKYDNGSKSKDIKNGLQAISEKYSEEAYNKYSFGDMAAASVFFEKAAGVAATAPLSALDSNAVYNAGFTAWLAGDNARAKKFFQKGLDAGYYGADGEAFAKLADIASKEGDAVASKNYLEQGFVKFPQSQSMLVGLINYYLSSGEDTNRLFELLDSAKKNEPGNASLYYVEGNINVKLGKTDEAVAAYRKSTEINPNYEFGYYGEGVMYYNKALEVQEKASQEMDDAKYMALMGEFETALKNCIAPFEKAFEVTKDADVKRGVAEYLKNACFRFRTESADFQAKYEKYSAAAE